MTMTHVHAIVARCLIDPDFLEQIQQAPEWRRDRLISDHSKKEVCSFDFETLRIVSGFIVKVQHNWLWESFPLTLLLLHRLSIELDVFTQYVPQFGALRKLCQNTPERRITSFLDFLESYFNRLDSTFAPVAADVMRHERILWELRAGVQLPEHLGEINTLGHGSLTITDIPEPRGLLRIARFSCHVFDAIEQLSSQSFDSEEIALRDCYIGYWRVGVNAEVSLLNLDLVTAVLLMFADGRKSIQDILYMSEQRGLLLSAQELLMFFDEAVAKGIVVMRRAVSVSKSV